MEPNRITAWILTFSLYLAPMVLLFVAVFTAFGWMEPQMDDATICSLICAIAGISLLNTYKGMALRYEIGRLEDDVAGMRDEIDALKRTETPVETI